MEEEGNDVFIADKGDCFKLRCKNGACRNSRSIFADTIFYMQKKEVNQMLLFFQLWLARADHLTIGGILGWTEKTVLQWCQSMRKLVTGKLLREMQNSASAHGLCGLIGGPGVEVQIDKSAFGKRNITVVESLRQNGS